jgi:Cu2+-exporting ATPase
MKSQHHHTGHLQPPDKKQEHEMHHLSRKHLHTEHAHRSMSNPPMGQEGHDHHAMMMDDFKKRFWISLILTVPVLLLSEMIQHWLGFEIKFTGDKYLLLVLSSVIFFYGGWPFLKGFTNELQAKSPGMMTLIALAITVAYVFSVAVMVGLEGMDFFWELATLIAIMLLGHWLEMKSVLGASKALQLLVGMMPAEAHLVHGDHIMDVKLEELKKDDIILIRPGEKVPADGVVMDGESFLNESMLTGESKPVKKEKNDRVIGGSINGNGSLQVKVMHTGKDSYLNKVITLVQEAQQTKSKTQRLADRAAKWLTYIALGVGFLTLIVWLALGQGTNYAIERMVTVMVISCPHALGLAIPLVVAISTAVSAQHGLLIRNRTAFENSRKITTLVFDKTGTLTKGEFGVTRIETTGQFSRNEILQYAAALEQFSEHPIATGIVKKAKEENIEILKAENFNAITGKGVEANVSGMNIKVVSPGYLREKQISIPSGITANEAETIVFVLLENQLAGYIALADEIRPESKPAIEAFKKNGIKVMMATGDNERVAKAVAQELGLDAYYAEVLPHQKVEIVKELQNKNEFVAMTGDGVNDAPALAQADVGIAVGSGTDVAAETADIILVNSNPKDILNLILFGKATYRKMVQNLIWATGYNAIAIPLAAGVLSASGFVLDPAIGAVFMSASTIIVAINAQLLKRQLNQ